MNVLMNFMEPTVMNAVPGILDTQTVEVNYLLKVVCFDTYKMYT